jgi:hypothetical protein
MSEKSTSKGKGDNEAQSPVLFAAMWFGLPLIIVVATVLFMKYF